MSQLAIDTIKDAKALFFDFDGLIFDSEWAAFDAWSRIYKQYGAQLDIKNYIECVGSGFHRFNPATHLKSIIDYQGSADDFIALKNIYKDELCQKMPPLPGVISFLKRIQDSQKPYGSQPKKCSVVSSSFRPWVETNLIRMGLIHHFECLTTGDEVKQIKPAPDLYLLAAQRASVDPSECVVFEDSFNGLVAATEAGMKCVVIPNRITDGGNFGQAVATLNSFQDIVI